MKQFPRKGALAAVAVVGAFAIGITGARVIGGRESGEPPTQYSEAEVAASREEFAEATVMVDGQAARTTGYRTIVETRISVELPPGMSMITASVLRADGKRIPARSFRSDGQVVTTSFPPTNSGGSVEFELGTLAMFRGEPSTVTVSMKDALDAADGDERFAIPASAVLNGDPVRVISGEQGRYGTRKWVGIEVSRELAVSRPGGAAAHV